jgi:hypothetical protein
VLRYDGDGCVLFCLRNEPISSVPAVTNRREQHNEPCERVIGQKNKFIVLGKLFPDPGS